MFSLIHKKEQTPVETVKSGFCGAWTARSHAGMTCPGVRTAHSHAGMSCPEVRTAHSHAGMSCPGVRTAHSHAGMSCPGVRTAHSRMGMSCPGVETAHSRMGMDCLRCYIYSFSRLAACKSVATVRGRMPDCIEEKKHIFFFSDYV
jgi:hypothetical protein